MKYLLPLVLLVAFGCSSGPDVKSVPDIETAIVSVAELPEPSAELSDVVKEDIPIVLPPTMAERIEEPAGSYLMKVGDRAKKIKGQKSWREMGSSDKPIAIKTPAQVVTTTIAPMITHSKEPVKIAPTGSKNIDNLITYVAGSVAAILIGVIYAFIKKK